MSTGAGFTLVEVMVATGLLLATVTAAGGLLGTTIRCASTTQDRERSSSEVQDWLCLVRALPFATTTDAPSDTMTVVAKLFPHADPGHNTATAEYHPSATPEYPAGSFTTRTELLGGSLSVTAQFAVCAGGQWGPAPMSALTGWGAAGASLPAPSLLLRLDYRSAHGSPPMQLTAVVSTALADARATPLP